MNISRLFTFLEQRLGAEHQDGLDVLRVIVVIHLLYDEVIQYEFLLAVLDDAFW